MWYELSTAEELMQRIDESSTTGTTLVVLKHSTRCGVSSMAMSRLERKPTSNVQYLLIDVIRNRALSQAMATWSGVQHESPQMFVIKAGQMVSVKSHMEVRPEAITTEV